MQRERGAAVVTGAGRGIGRALALDLARIGYPVGLQSRTGSELEEVRGLIESAGGRALVVPGDVTEEESADELVRRSAEAFGPLEVSVACAGRALSAPLHRTKAADLHALLEVNVMSAFHLLSASAREMREKKTKGRIVIVASIAAVRGARYTSAYSASKHACLGLVRSAALELAPIGITVNALCPGWVDTPMFDETTKNIAAKTGCTQEEARQKIASMIPMGSVLTSEEIAGALAFIVSDAAVNFTGQTLIVDGGETLA